MSQLVANLDPEVERHFTRPRGKLALWTGVLGGPLAWSVQLLFCYVLVRFMCGREWLSVVNHVATLVLLAAALACVLLALREWNRVRREDPQAPGHTFADLRGMWVGQDTTKEEIDAILYRLPPDLEQ